MLLGAAITYLTGTVGITGLGNVPLNDHLEALDLADISTQKMEEFRSYYEINWNRLHLIRTVFALLAFLLAVLALFIKTIKTY